MGKEPVLQDVLDEIKALREDIRASRRRLLPVEDAAAYLGISAKTVRNGLGPRAKCSFPVKPIRVGGRVLFDKKSLDAFIDGGGVTK